MKYNTMKKLGIAIASTSIGFISGAFLGSLVNNKLDSLISDDVHNKICDDVKNGCYINEKNQITLNKGMDAAKFAASIDNFINNHELSFWQTLSPYIGIVGGSVVGLAAGIFVPYCLYGQSGYDFSEPHMD